jgi:hypothetical protein
MVSGGRGAERRRSAEGLYDGCNGEGQRVSIQQRGRKKQVECEAVIST